MYIDTNGFELGDEVRDTITGFTGVVTGVHQYTTGCARLSLQPKVGKDGKVPDTYGVDVLVAEMVKRGPRNKVDTSKGGPRIDPAQHQGRE